MVQNNCTPQRIYGGFEQTLFLGLTVIDFSASVGWDQQSTTMAIKLVNDNCAGRRWYYKVNEDSEPAWEWVYEEFADGDPGFNNADVGSPVLFKIGETRELDENGLPTDTIISKGFEFAGIIQSYNLSDGTDGENVLTVNLISPGMLLEGASVIVGEFAEEIPLDSEINDVVPNVFNIYGFLESIYNTETGEFQCPAVGGFGSPCGGYGNARATEAGIPWYLAKQALQVLAGGRYNGGFGTCNFARPPGVLSFKPGVNSYGSLPDGDYILDLDDLPVPENEDDLNHYRIAGPIKTISELINEVADDAGANYYVDMLPVFDTSNPNKITNIIKIRVVQREASAPSEPLTDIIDFIASKQTDAGTQVVTAQSIGEEYIPEYTSAFIIGGKQTRLYQASAGLTDQYNTPIVPFMGIVGDQDFANNIEQGAVSTVKSQWSVQLAPGCVDYQWYFYLPWTSLPFNTPPNAAGLGLNLPYAIPESMLCAAAHDPYTFITWLFTYAQGAATVACPAYKHPIVDWIQNQLGMADPAPAIGAALKGVMAGQAATKGSNVFGVGAGGPWGNIQNANVQDIFLLFQFLHQTYHTYYGKAFIVKVPFVCYRDITKAADGSLTNITDPNETPIYEFSDVPATEGGWADTLVGGTSNYPGVATILGLNHRQETDFFSAPDGRLGGLVRWDAVYSNFNNQNVDVTNAFYKQVSLDLGTPGLWISSKTQPSWVFYQDQTPGSLETYVGALLITNNTVELKPDPNDIVTNPYLGNYNYNLRTTLGGGPGGNLVNLNTFVNYGLDRSFVVRPVGVPFALPRDAVVPIQSNTKNYGPWYFDAKFPNTDLEVKGKTYVTKDDSLTPWDYGGSKYMERGANYLASTTISDVDRGERGQITIAGYPENQLGAEITKSPINLSDRVITLKDYGGYDYIYLDVGGVQTATSQITNMSVTVGPGAITTQYQLSSFTPFFGQFNKDNQDRLKQLGQNIYQTNRNTRAQVRSKRALEQQIISAFAAQGGISPLSPLMNTAFAPGSSHLILLGKYQYENNGNFEDKDVSTTSIKDMAVLGPAYDSSSMMSMDGLLRPVRNRGSAPSAEATYVPSEVAPGVPTSSDQDFHSESPAGPLSQYKFLKVDKDYLQFLQNPGDASSARDSLGSGHDIEIVGRSTLSTIDANNDGFLGIQDTGNTTRYTDDYRYLAMRGPLMIQGWGYDLLGKPIPNVKDTGAALGAGNHQKTYSGLEDEFYAGFLKHPETWPVAPVDLRFDRRRGVWTVPNDFRFYLGTLRSSLTSVGQTAICDIVNAEDVYDANGSLVQNPTVNVTMPYKNKSITQQDVLVYYSHESGQWWPLASCCDTSGCGGKACTFVAEVTGSGASTGLQWVDQEECCDNFICIDPTGNPSYSGEVYSSTCGSCDEQECTYTSVSDGGTGFIWADPTGCGGGGCDNFKCKEPTGAAPTGAGLTYNSTCIDCEYSSCTYSGSGGQWVASSGNCNGQCVSGTIKCSEPTGTPTGDGAIQSGDCIPCDEYPCRFVGVTGAGGGLAWQETGLGCTGCENESGTFSCVEPEYLPLQEGQIFTSVCKPEPPRPTGASCTINQISLNCGLESGIEITTTPISFFISGDELVCQEGSGTTVLCDTCCGSGDTPTTPTGSCNTPCGWTAYCPDPFPPLGPCDGQVLEWREPNGSPQCSGDCTCAAPPYEAFWPGEGYVSDCVGGATDGGGTSDQPDDPIIDWSPEVDGTVQTDPTNETNPTVDTTTTDGSSPTIGPVICTVTLGDDLTYNTNATVGTAVSPVYYKPARAAFGTGYFATPLTGTGEGGITGYPHYLSMISRYGVVNVPKSYTYTATGDCSDTSCSGDSCDYTSTGTTINDWVLSTPCTGCACDCPYPTSAPPFSGAVQGQVCAVATGADGSPATGTRYSTGIEYRYNLPSGTQLDIIYYSGGAYRILDVVRPNITVSGDFNRISFYEKVFADASTGNIIITLPATTGNGIKGVEHMVKKIDSSSNQVIISGTGSDVIDGSATYTLFNQYESISIMSHKSGEWYLY